MLRIELNNLLVESKAKIGDDCPFYEPNITEDCILCVDGVPVGFYLKKLPEKLSKLADIANAELKSDRVPKSIMKRQTGVKQYSCIIGSIPPKATMRRHLPNQSSVHASPKAQTFIKAMWKLAVESEKLIKELTPNIYEQQVELFKQVPEQWRLGNLFTSSISNYNIPAPFHRDNGNIIGAVNVIITKRKNAKGGCLHVPDYNATFDQADNSILVYPAWRNVHGVTPILPTHETGYRNSLVFYPLAAFLNSNLTKSTDNNTGLKSE